MEGTLTAAPEGAPVAAAASAEADIRLEGATFHTGGAPGGAIGLELAEASARG